MFEEVFHFGHAHFVLQRCVPSWLDWLHNSGNNGCMQHFTQYIPLSVYELESWLGNPSIYVFDCSAAGMIVNAFCEVSFFNHLRFRALNGTSLASFKAIFK